MAVPLKTPTPPRLVSGKKRVNRLNSSPAGTARAIASERGENFLTRGISAYLDQQLPTRWVKTIVGFFLLPFVWALTQAFFGSLAYVTWSHHFWQSAEFQFFLGGALAWVVIFFTLPRPMLIYVYGHEFTHALCVWLMGGEVLKINCSSEGGHVISSKVNTIIALAPYFLPLYSILALLIYVEVGVFMDMSPYYNYLLASLGFTWAFHFTFTCWMIPKGQTDLMYGGHFFSLIIIYLANVSILSVMLIVANPSVTFYILFTELWSSFARILELTGAFFEKITLAF